MSRTRGFVRGHGFSFKACHVAYMARSARRRRCFGEFAVGGSEGASATLGKNREKIRECCCWYAFAEVALVLVRGVVSKFW